MTGHLKRIDWSIVLAASFLALVGIAFIYSSSFFRQDFLNFKKQILFFSLGLALMFLASFLNWRILKDKSFIFIAYFLLVLSLIFLFLLAPQIRGVKSWYRLAIFSFDPVEPLKIILIIILAKYFSLRHTELYNLRHIFFSSFYMLVPFVLVAYQPDLGSALVLVFLWLGILVFSGIKLKHFFLILLLGLILASFLWVSFLKPYQKERIISFLMPNFSPLGAGWSQLQARIAIGSGGLWGKGFRQGPQTQLGFLSLPQTDFIFSAITEELGFVGAATVLLVFLWLIVKILMVADGFQSNFPRLFSFGLALSFFIEGSVHIGMNLGVLPVAGLPFPFVSYGGSSLVSNFLALGILQSLIADTKK